MAGRSILYVSELLQKQKKHAKTFAALQEAVLSAGGQLLTLAPTKDVWARDFMPIAAAVESEGGTGQLVQFQYAPDMLRKHAYLRTDAKAVGGALAAQGLYPATVCDVTLDGGHVVRLDAHFAVSDDVLRQRGNAGRSEEELGAVISESLGLPILWLPAMPEDETGHLDGALAALGGGRVAVNAFEIEASEEEDAVLGAWGVELRERLTAAGYTCEDVPAYLLSVEDDPKLDGIASAEGLYLNFVRCGTATLVPQFQEDQDFDRRVLERLGALLPGCQMIGVPTYGLEHHGGILHCVTWEHPSHPSLL